MNFLLIFGFVIVGFFVFELFFIFFYDSRIYFSSFVLDLVGIFRRVGSRRLVRKG